MIGFSGTFGLPIKKTENFIGFDAFVGGSFAFRGAYGAIAPHINLGKNGLFFMAGFDLKSYQFPIGILFDQIIHEGITISPFLGLHLIKESNLSFRLRISVLPIFEEKKIDRYYPAFGISLGYRFI